MKKNSKDHLGKIGKIDNNNKTEQNRCANDPDTELSQKKSLIRRISFLLTKTQQANKNAMGDSSDTKKRAPKSVLADFWIKFNKKTVELKTKWQKTKKKKQRHKKSEQAKIARIRAKNDTKKAERAKKKQARRAALSELSKDDRKAFLLTEKKKKKSGVKRQKTRQKTQRRKVAAMSADEQKAYFKKRRAQKLLEKKAKRGYVPRQVMKYVLLAALAFLIVYAGNVAYGAFVDNSYAFQNTGNALTPPPTATRTPKPTQTAAAPTPTPTLNPYELLLSQADLDFMENRVNILLLGIDESLERSDWRSFRTDTMILLSIDFETNDVFMISLPRDSFVWIYNKDERARINSAFAYGGGYDKSGFEYAMNTVSMALGGVPVNHYVCFDMNVVKEVVDAIGGLEYDVDVHVDMCGREIEPGLQYMDGQMVLDYCRQRKGSSDIARAERQQRMIFAIFEHVKDTSQIQHIPDMYAAVNGNIYTDLHLSQIASLAAFAMGVDMDDLERYMLPGDYLNIDGTSLWGIDQYEKRDLVAQLFGVKIKISKDDDVGVLNELAAQKRQAVAAASSAAHGADSYVSANRAYIEAQEYDTYKAKVNHLRSVAAVKDVQNVGPTIAPIITAINDLNAWLDALKAAVAQRASATPTPAPPTPVPTESAVSTPATTQTVSPTQTAAPTATPTQAPPETPTETPASPTP